MFTFLISAIKIIFVLGFLILIHEGGHFIVARICKVTVNEFSIGFGPIIWTKKGKNTKYTLRLIPLGGFVNLEGEDERSEEEGSFSKASIPKRMAIILAGGFVNIIFAVIVYFILMTSMGDNTSLVIENIVTNENVITQSELQENDEIIKINNKNVHIKSDIEDILEKSNGEELTIIIKRNNELKEIRLTPIKQEYKNTGIYLKSLSSGESTKIVTVGANSSAEKQGLQANDEIIKINNKEVNNQTQIIEEINNIKSETLVFTVKRLNNEMNIELKPEIAVNYYLGVQFKKAENTLLNNMYYALYNTNDFVFSIIDNLKMLFTGNVRVNQLMGPVGISEVVAKTTSIEDYVYILALISLSLGVTNLLPIPALDGGKFVLLILEAIRRKKLSEKVEINIQLIGFALLIGLSIYVAYNDILRIF